MSCSRRAESFFSRLRPLASRWLIASSFSTERSGSGRTSLRISSCRWMSARMFHGPCTSSAARSTCEAASISAICWSSCLASSIRLARCVARSFQRRVCRDELFDLLAQLVAAGQRAAGICEAAFSSVGQQALAGRFDLANHIDQRDAVEAAGQAVEIVGGGRVVERAELLNFLEADGEDVVVGRLIDAGEQGLELRGVARLAAVVDDLDAARDRPADR